MTREELVKKMGGREDRAEWVMEKLLQSVKPGFIETMLKALTQEADREIAEKYKNGYYMDDYMPPEDFNYFSHSLAVDGGNDPDGSKAAAIAKYDLYESRQFEKSADSQERIFLNNMYACFKAH